MAQDPEQPLAHRAHPRWPISLEVHIQTMGWDERVMLRTADLSLGGAFLATQRELTIGTHLQLNFVIPEKADSLVFADVVRVVDPETAHAQAIEQGVGVRFIEPDPDFLELVINVLDAAAEEANKPAPEYERAADSPVFEDNPDAYAKFGPATTPSQPQEASPSMEDDDEDDWLEASLGELSRHAMMRKRRRPGDPVEEAAPPDADFDPFDTHGAIAAPQDYGGLGNPDALNEGNLPPPLQQEVAVDPFASLAGAPTQAAAQPKGTPTLIDVGQAIELVDRGMSLIKEEKFASAHELAQVLLSQQPKNRKMMVVLHLAAGGLFKEAGQHDRAILHFQDAADLDEKCAFAIEQLRSYGVSRRKQHEVKSSVLRKLKETQRKRKR